MGAGGVPIPWYTPTHPQSRPGGQGPPAAPRLTLDEGCGGVPVTLHLPAGAAAARLRGHSLPLQDVGGHRGRRGLPVHPEAALAPGHGPEPGQGLTCMGTTRQDDRRAEHPCHITPRCPPSPCPEPALLLALAVRPTGSLCRSPPAAHPGGCLPRSGAREQHPV